MAFLFPWAVVLSDLVEGSGLQALSSLGLLSMLVFLIVLTIGFVYEWKKGALEWE